METNFLFKLWIIIKLCLYYVLILFSYNREKEYFCYHKISIIYESIFQ